MTHFDYQSEHGICEITRWEDEGGVAVETLETSTMPEESLDSVQSPLNQHLDDATTLLADGKVDDAVKELAAAAERFLAYKARINTSINTSLGQLSTRGCRATAPHPKALDLVHLKATL